MTDYSSSEIACLVTLLSTNGIGTKTLAPLYDALGSWHDVLHAPADLLDAHRVRTSARTALTKARTSYAQSSPADTLAPYRDAGVHIVTKESLHYPTLLREADDAPHALFVRGNLDALTAGPFVTIVGAREHTRYGERATYSLAHDLAKSGVTVVSGLARGIDGIAHKSALDAHGVTIGVLGGGVDDASISPRQNVRTAHAMLERGAIMSEYPIGTKPTNYTFPARNRIMAAMAQITLVVEAAEPSGTLITARAALEYNRDVCAVPGDIFSPQSTGANALIRDGAKIVTNVADILAELPRIHPTTQPASAHNDAHNDAHNEAHDDVQNNESAQPQHSAQEVFAQLLADLPESERAIARHLSREPLHVDKITSLSKLETTEALGALSMLEIKGIARDIGGRHYVRTH